jgi:hypothetical protein
MKSTAGLLCLGTLYGGALWVAYQTTLLLGAGCLFLASASGLAVLASALRSAPEGDERHDGFHVRVSRRRHTPVRNIRFWQPARARQ